MDFKNTVIIMTSNIGARRISERKSFGFGENSDNHSDQNRIKEDVMSELRREFRPELLNRIDDIIVFQQLSKEDIQEIARRMLRTLSKRVSEQMNVELTFSDEAITAIADAGFDPVYGARPLRRAIQTSIEDALSEQILEGKSRRVKRSSAAMLTGPTPSRPNKHQARILPPGWLPSGWFSFWLQNCKLKIRFIGSIM